MITIEDFKRDCLIKTQIKQSQKRNVNMDYNQISISNIYYKNY